jgi:hypothetical protein
MIRNYQTPSVVITNGQTTSNAFVTKDFAWGSYQVQTMVGTGVTFLVSNDGVHFAALNDSTGTAIALATFAAGQINPFPDELFYHAYAQIVSNTTENSGNVIFSVLCKG